MLNTPKVPNIFDLIYPVGAIFITVGSTDPNVVFGGTWEKLAGGYALLTTNNTGGGDTSATDASNHIPGRAFQGGLPNISGYTSWGINGKIDGSFGYGQGYHTDSQALYATKAGKTYGCIGTSGTDSAGADNTQINIDASRSNDRYGTYQGTRTSVVPDHIAVVMWKRTALGVTKQYIALLIFSKKRKEDRANVK